MKLSVHGSGFTVQGYEMSGLSSSRDVVVRKRNKALMKINSLREAFEKKKEAISEDLEESRRIWGELGKKFPWWGSLP